MVDWNEVHPRLIANVRRMRTSCSVVKIWSYQSEHNRAVFKRAVDNLGGSLGRIIVMAKDEASVAMQDETEPLWMRQ